MKELIDKNKSLRKVFRISNSYALTLPPDWVRKHLKDSKNVIVEILPDENILVIPATRYIKKAMGDVPT